MRTTFTRFYTAVCLLAIFLSYGDLRAESARLRQVFEGKTIRIIHGSSPGGGYDLVARAFGRFLRDYLPGKPARVIVQPRPGGGPFRLKSLRALIRAKPDGLTIGYAYSAWLVAEAIGEGPAGLNLKDLEPLGTPLGAYSDNVYCARSEVATSWKDIEKLGRPIKWAGIAPGVSAILMAAPWLKEIGAPVKVIWGYGGSSETNAAFRRGEAELIASCKGNLRRDYRDWAKRGNVAPIFWLGKATAAGDATLKQMGLKRPPHIYEVAKEYITADWQKEVFEVALNLARLSKFYFVPAGAPKEVVAAWRETFRKIVNDPRFKMALHPTYRDDLSPMYAEEMKGILNTIKGLSPEALSSLKFLVTGRRR